MPDLTVTGAADTGPRVWAQSGYGPADMDALQLYDAFTINPILFLEDLGFCPKGEGGRCPAKPWRAARSEEHTSELQSLMRISYAVFCLKTKTSTTTTQNIL